MSREASASAASEPHHQPAPPSGCGDLDAAFAHALDALGPFGSNPMLAVAVSGGADSMALALLAAGWAATRNGRIQGFTVDHGLRPESAGEARSTIARLAACGIQCDLLTLHDLARGSALAERARIARYEALTAACRAANLQNLLLAHHALDQIETVAMRVLRDSGTHGLAGMSAVRLQDGIRLLRPLLNIHPRRLRAFLTTRGVTWIEDPSNRDCRAERPRLRHLFAPQLTEASVAALLAAITSAGRLRAQAETAAAAELAERANIRSEGFAVLSPGRISQAALARLIRIVGNAPYPADAERIAVMAAAPAPGTLAGVRFLAAGRAGSGWLVVREESRMQPPAPLHDKQLWDERFRVSLGRAAPEGATIGGLGVDAPRFRELSKLPSAVLRTLPAIRFGKVVAAVPHLGYSTFEDDVQMTVLFAPRSLTDDLSFVPAN